MLTIHFIIFQQLHVLVCLLLEVLRRLFLLSFWVLFKAWRNRREFFFLDVLSALGAQRRLWLRGFARRLFFIARRWPRRRHPSEAKFWRFLWRPAAAWRGSGAPRRSPRRGARFSHILSSAPWRPPWQPKQRFPASPSPFKSPHSHPRRRRTVFRRFFIWSFIPICIPQDFTPLLPPFLGRFSEGAAARPSAPCILLGIWSPPMRSFAESLIIATAIKAAQKSCSSIYSSAHINRPTASLSDNSALLPQLYPLFNPKMAKHRFEKAPCANDALSHETTPINASHPMPTSIKMRAAILALQLSTHRLNHHSTFRDENHIFSY